MKHLRSQQTDSLLHELDLGQHMLFLLSDGSIDLLAKSKQTPQLVHHGLRLDSDETYRLLISLQAQWKQQEITHETR